MSQCPARGQSPFPPVASQHTNAHTVQLAEGKCKLEIKVNGVQQLATSLTAATGTHMPPGKGNTPALATYAKLLTTTKKIKRA